MSEQMFQPQEPGESSFNASDYQVNARDKKEIIERLQQQGDEEIYHSKLGEKVTDIPDLKFEGSNFRLKVSSLIFVLLVVINNST